MSVRKITFIALIISFLDVLLLTLVENWNNFSHIQSFIKYSFIHILIILIVLALFYYSAKADKKLWFTKYVLSGASLIFLVQYNLGAINVIFSKSHAVPYILGVILWMLVIVPILGVLLIISLIERYLKQKR